jgi:hypothetical protein
VPRIVRCIKEDGTNYAVPVNQPVQVIQKPPQPGQANTPDYKPVDPNAPQGQQGMQSGATMQGMQGQMPMPGMQPPQMSPEQSAELAGVIKTFDLAAGKYDVTCESGPSFTTRREEAAAQMMQFVQAFPQSAPVIGDLIAKSLDWPGSDEIAKRLQSMLPPQAQSGAKPPQLMMAEQAIDQLKQQIQQMQQQLQQAGQQVNEKQSDLQLRNTELQLKAQELQIKQFEAETKRMAEQANANQTPTAPADHSFDAWKLEQESAMERWKTEQDNALKIAIAKLESDTTLQVEMMRHQAKEAEQCMAEAEMVPEQVEPVITTIEE